MNIRTLSVEDLTPELSSEINRREKPLEDPLKYVSDIQVKLEFKIGHSMLTIEELRQLKPGSTLKFDLDRGLLLDIFLNGHLIGNGHLVEVDGILGVQVEQMVAE